jgi:hypothetical protein
MRRYFFKISALLILAIGCKVAYQPPVTSAPSNYLVIEGTINSNNNSTDSTFFKLSRTVAISSITSNPELHAQITIEDGQNYSFALKDLGKGTYGAGPLGIDITKKYRARIKTSDGKFYLSDLEPVIYTPPIDSIGFTATTSGIQLYINTHNPANNTRYYRWDFSETWKISTAFISTLVSNGSLIVDRTPAQDVHTCWASDASTGVALGSSAKLVQDVISQAPLTFIGGNSEKIGVRYSILLKQYGLTADAFSFWDQLRKNTESLGTIFDAQPSQISGNIHCTTNPTEQVFGYISITNIQSKRVYINKGVLPGNFQSALNASCFFNKEDTAFNVKFLPPFDHYLYTATDILPTSSIYVPISYNPAFSLQVAPPPAPPLSPIQGYYVVKRECGDCTLRGSTTKPSFWVDQ